MISWSGGTGIWIIPLIVFKAPDQSSRQIFPVHIPSNRPLNKESALAKIKEKRASMTRANRENRAPAQGLASPRRAQDPARRPLGDRQ
jgi:hypothetical protein